MSSSDFFGCSRTRRAVRGTKRRNRTLPLSFACTVWCVLPLLAGHKETISVASPAMDRSFRATVVLPDSYGSSEATYPVIYMLHGYGASHKTWSRVAPLADYADTYDLIFVCPDAERASWYVDSPVRGGSKFATYVGVEVVSAVDKRYRTRADRSGRALIGSSMGGHGAMTLLARHPERFAGAGSISGPMDLSPFSQDWELSRVLGPLQSNEQRYHEHSFVGLAQRLTGADAALILDCGADDWAAEVNRQAHQLLQELGISHEYRENAGGHTPDYVASNVVHHIAYFSRLFRGNEGGGR